MKELRKMKIQSTTVIIDRIRCYAYHGVLPQERVVGGDYWVSARLTLSDASLAVEEDQLEGTVNYAEVCELIRREMQCPSALLEHVAGRMLKAIFSEFPLVAEAEVEVRKVNPPMGVHCDGAAVVMRAVR